MKALLRRIRQILRDRRTRRIFTRFVSTVAAIVVFATTYALVLPAITMESRAECGIEAHQHDESCYTDVLVCEIPESPGHVHDESCYSTGQKLVCRTEEHMHEPDCYDENGQLICGKAEHQHGEDCFEEEQELVCRLTESDGHQHDDSCYQKVLTCGKEAHTHSAACYHVDSAGQSATEAIAVASTESAAAGENSPDGGLDVGPDAAAEYSESETSPGASTSSAGNSAIETGPDSSTSSAENSAFENSSFALTDEAGADYSGARVSAGASTGSAADTAASAGTSTGSAADTGASSAAGYVPVLDELDFDTLLNKFTGIYYSRPDDTGSADDGSADTGSADDGSADAGSADDGSADTGSVDAGSGSDADTESGGTDTSAKTGEAREAAAWNRADRHTELTESDKLRLYLAYTVPAGSLNETNQTARYRLPANVRLTDEQVNSINTTVNGITAQYVSYDTLEILDQEMYEKYLGIEAVEGTRAPSDDLSEYLADHGGQEFISATVKVENVYDEETGALKAQEMVFTFAPYTIQKNQHQYDTEGQPIKAGEEVKGWLAVEIGTEQIEWEEADGEVKAADILFVEKDKKAVLGEISTELRLIETADDPDAGSKKTADADGPDAADADKKQDGTKDSGAEDGETENGESDKAGKEPVSYPSVSFDDSITVAGGSLSTDADAVSGDERLTAETEITVRVEADKGTFPEGTTMVLSAVSDDRMSAVAQAVEGAVDSPKTMGFHAVDISFRNAEGKEIEPLKSIRVSMTSDAIKRAVEDVSTAPVVVHVSDPAADGTAPDRNTDDGDRETTAVPDENSDNGDSESAAGADGNTEDEDSDSAAAADAVEGAEDRHGPEPSESMAEQASENSQEAPAAPTATVIEASTGTDEGQGDTLTFKAEDFSVYAVVYTVDFHWEVNGKMYDFSIPGGGFVSLEHLVEVLGIGVSDPDSENQADEAETAEVSADDVESTEDGQVPGDGSVELVFGNEAIKLNEVEVSEAARRFVADVESVEFSNSELVWAGKAEEAVTVGGLKKANGLEVVYSADLTEEQIQEINAQTVEAGDWALISMQPFTSEETLTVTMKNGDKWTVKVTDAQKPYKDVSTLVDGTYIIFRSDNSSSRFMFMKNDGTTDIIFPEYGQSLSASDLSAYTWTVTGNGNGYFTIKSTRDNRYINLYGNNNEYNKWSNNNWASVALSGSNGIAIAHNGKVLKRDDNGFFNATGTGVGLTFYKIEANSSGGSTDSPGIVLTDSEREYFEKWEKTLETFNTLTDYDKTAEVLNDDQRMYKIDITASSGITDFYKDVDLGFVLDISNSMQFPSSLKALEDRNGNEYKVWMTADALNAAKTAYANEYNKQGCFYIISDPALTSTIYRVFWDGRYWRYQDASELGSDNVYYINDGTVFKEPYRQTYTLYYADDTKKRFTYLQESVTNAINILHKIVKPTEHVDDETASVRVAYNLFASEIYESDSFKDLREQANNLFAIPLEYTKSGTRQDLALYDGDYNPANWWTSPDSSDLLSANEFGWDSGSDQYVILVTDGAPNGASMNDVRAAAANLKRQYPNIKIFTIGLSTKDVDGGSEMLYDIADTVGGVRQFYEAEKAQDLEYILLKILRTIMAEGLVRGKITDTIDKGFYPVDLQGNPLSAGVYKNGTLVPNVLIRDYVSGGKPTEAHQNEAFYTWEQVGDEWKITWYNQSIGWDDNQSSTGNPWTGTVYVKAKEDYLGGNLIETNDGNAQIEPTGIKLVINEQPEANWRPLENMEPVDLPVPRVDVHELETKENSTTWTIYKGTSVTPKEQLEALWNNILIEEVVSATENSQHKRTTGSGANVGTNGDGETFTLGSLMTEIAPTFSIDSLIDQITAAGSTASASFEYEAYDHKSGTITVKVERTKGNKTPAMHTADTVGNEVEQYKVTFTYTPYTEAKRHQMISAGWTEAEQDDYDENGYHNGQNGRGDPAGTMTSTNTHTISVFQKGIRFTKVDKTNTNQTLTGAVFELFRADADGNADVSNYTLPDGNYTKVGNDLSVNSAGVIVINPIIPDVDGDVLNKTLYQPNIAVGDTENVSHDTVFYLVEKTPPATYSAMPGAIKVTMTLSENKGTDASAALYDWTQTAVVSAAEYRNGSTEYLISNGTDGDISLYKIKNGKTSDITLIKVDKVSHDSISGAKFCLQRGSENVDLTKLTITAIVGGAVVTPEDYDLNGTVIKVVTVPEGGIRISGLTDDTYTLREVSAPAGYLITDTGKDFKTENGAIKNIDGSAHQNEAPDINFEVENESGAALPNTGGPGPGLIYLLGIMLTGLAGAGLAMRLRRKAV